MNTPPNTEEFADKVFTAALGTMETFNLYLDEPSIQAANANAEAAGVADRTRFVVAAGQTLSELGPLMLPSRSNAFTTCRARLTYWRRYTERSVPTDWW